MPRSIMASARTFDRIAAVQPAPGMDRQAIPRELIDQIQYPHRPSIVCERADEVVRPDVIGPFRPQPHARTVVAPQATSWFLLLRNF
jgi:hypothetical protein